MLDYPPIGSLDDTIESADLFVGPPGWNATVALGTIQWRHPYLAEIVSFESILSDANIIVESHIAALLSFDLFSSHLFNLPSRKLDHVPGWPRGPPFLATAAAAQSATFFSSFSQIALLDLDGRMLPAWSLWVLFLFPLMLLSFCDVVIYLNYDLEKSDCKLIGHSTLIVSIAQSVK